MSVPSGGGPISSAKLLFMALLVAAGVLGSLLRLSRLRSPVLRVD
jgi:hypothetical protein